MSELGNRRTPALLRIVAATILAACTVTTPPPTSPSPSGVANSPTATYAASPPPIATNSPAPTQTPYLGIGVRLDNRGVPIDIEGEPVFEGPEIGVRIADAMDDSPFLIVGSMSVQGWANCPIPTDLPSSPLLSTCDPASGFQSNKGGETYELSLVFDDPDLARRGSLLVFRVHIHDGRATECPSAYRERCEEAVVVEARVWPTASATPYIGVRLDERGMPIEIDGEHVFEGQAIPRRIGEAADARTFLVLGILHAGSATCFVSPDPPSPPFPPCTDGTTLQSTKNGETYWVTPLGGDLGSAPTGQSIVLRVHVHDALAATCPNEHREQCERVVVADAVVWPSGDEPSPAPTPTPVPTITPSLPADLETEIADERDEIRVNVRFGQNPLSAGALNYVNVEIGNTGADEVVWLHDGCGIAVGIHAQMSDSSWPVGISQSGAAATFKEKALSNGHSPDDIEFSFLPPGFLGSTDITCSDIGIEEHLAPGETLNQQLLWDGYAQGWGVPPPDGPVDISLWVSNFSRAGAQDRPRQSWTIERERYLWVTGGSGSPAISPAAAVDAALATPGLIGWLEPKVFGNIEPLVWFDPDIDAWQVGAVDYLAHTLHVVLVDARSGAPRGVIDRHWDEDGYP